MATAPPSQYSEYKTFLSDQIFSEHYRIMADWTILGVKVKAKQRLYWNMFDVFWNDNVTTLIYIHKVAFCSFVW